MKSSLLFCFLVVCVQSQLSLVKEDECKENEKFNTCGSACEPSCDNPNPSFCTLQCVVGCQCDKGFVRNSKSECVKQEQCGATSASSASPILPAILPAPTNTTLNCGINEIANECHNACTEKKCPNKFAPLVNCLMACHNGCSCQKGFVRNNQGQCVKESECPKIDTPPTDPSTENQCNLIDCRSGMRCQIQDGNPVCLPESLTTNSTGTMNNSTEVLETVIPSGCATVRCTSDTECVETTRNCTGAKCKVYAECVQKQNDTTASSCASVSCMIGTICQEIDVQCFAAPCPKQAVCINSNSNNSTVSGGCATVRCASDTQCVETTRNCTGAKCKTYAECVPIQSDTVIGINSTASGCASISCPVGEFCEETTVPCFVAPCPKVATCVPSDTSKNSTVRGGCDVVRCNKDETCEEQVVQCIKAPCPVQVVCIKKITHSTNGTTPTNSTTAPSTHTCPQNQTFIQCLNTCSESKCTGMEKNMMCTKHCKAGCGCSTGFLRSSDGECYQAKDCPADQLCGDNEEYRCEKCVGTCKNPQPQCDNNKKCKKSCTCAAGFVKKNGKCVTLASCPDHDHGNITCLGTEEYTDCLPQCRQLCTGVQECDTQMSTTQCKPGCVCRNNYKTDSDGVCVHNRHCFKTTTCNANEEWSKCTTDEVYCSTISTTKLPQRDQCFSGCVCAAGFARNSNGTCVDQKTC